MLTLMHTIVIEHYLRIIGEFYNVCGDFTWSVTDCEELVGVSGRYHRIGARCGHGVGQGKFGHD
jgi:hypothetical protein